MGALWEPQSHHRVMAGPLYPSKGSVWFRKEQAGHRHLHHEEHWLLKVQGWEHVLQPSPFTSPGCDTSQWSMGRETQECEGPWRGEPLWSLRHMPAGRREGHQPPLTSNTRCWEPGSQGCLGTAGQRLSPRHPWMTPSFLLSSPLLAQIRTPALGGLAAASTTVPDPEQSPDTVNQGMVPQLPLPSGLALAVGSRASLSGLHWRALGGAKVGPCRASGWGFTKGPDVFTVASCLALISSNTLINWCEGWHSRI